MSEFSSHKPVKVYHRYGGFGQLHPLTEEEKKYDDTCRHIDDMERKISEKSMALFTASEYGWFNWFVNKMFFGLKQDQLDRQLSDLISLLNTLESRESKT